MLWCPILPSWPLNRASSSVDASSSRSILIASHMAMVGHWTSRCPPICVVVCSGSCCCCCPTAPETAMTKIFFHKSRSRTISDRSKSIADSKMSNQSMFCITTGEVRPEDRPNRVNDASKYFFQAITRGDMPISLTVRMLVVVENIFFTITTNASASPKAAAATFLICAISRVSLMRSFL